MKKRNGKQHKNKLIYGQIYSRKREPPQPILQSLGRDVFTLGELSESKDSGRSWESNDFQVSLKWVHLKTFFTVSEE